MITQQVKVLAWLTLGSVGMALASWSFIYGETGRTLLALIIVGECLVLIRINVPVISNLYQRVELTTPSGARVEDLFADDNLTEIERIRRDRPEAREREKALFAFSAIAAAIIAGVIVIAALVS